MDAFPLNQDVLEIIFEHCAASTLLSLWCTCRHMRGLLRSYLDRNFAIWLRNHPESSAKDVILLALRFMSSKAEPGARLDAHAVLATCQKLSKSLGESNPYPALPHCSDATSPISTEEAEHFVESHFRRVDVSKEHTIDEFCRILYTKCHSRGTPGTFVQYQNALATSPRLEMLFGLAQMTSYSSSTREKIFRLLGQMCFRNPTACSVVGTSEALQQAVIRLMSSADSEPTLKLSSMYTFIAPANNVWEIHPALSPLVPLCISIVYSNEPHEKLRLTCEQFIGTLSYNPASQQFLAESGIGQLFLKPIRENVDLHPSAALSVANVFKYIAPSVKHKEERLVAKILMTTLVASCKGNAYPPDSNSYFTPWKVAYTLFNLSTHPRGLAALRLIPHIERQLAACLPFDFCGDYRMVENTLKLMWNLSPLSSRNGIFLET